MLYIYSFPNLFSPIFKIYPGIAESETVEPNSQKDQVRELWNPFHLLYSEQGKML